MGCFCCAPQTTGFLERPMTIFIYLKNIHWPALAIFRLISTNEITVQVVAEGSVGVLNFSFFCPQPHQALRTTKSTSQTYSKPHPLHTHCQDTKRFHLSELLQTLPSIPLTNSSSHLFSVNSPLLFCLDGPIGFPNLEAKSNSVPWPTRPCMT